MPAYGYFILKTSDNAIEKKFRVVYNGYSRILKKNGGVDDTIDGDIDVSVGSIKERHQYIVRVREDEEEEGFGDKYDLEYFFRLDDPNGTPSNKIKFTDHYGNEHEVFMMGEFAEQTIGIMIIGETAWFFVNCLFIFKPENEELY